jgi:hypothetical protein
MGALCPLVLFLTFWHFVLQSPKAGAAEDVSTVHQTSKHIDQENMHRIKCIEQVLQISNPSASLMVVEIE